MLFNLILRNVKRNLQVYLIYFLSLSIIYALLYAFNAVPNHPVMGSLSGAKANMTNIFGQYMGILAYVIIMIIIFLVVYSTNFVLKRRKKELGLYSVLGMRTPKIVSILSFETLIINLLSLVLGLCVGTGFLSILAKIADIMFQSGYTGGLFYIDLPSILLLVIAYGLTSFIIVLMNILTFRKKRLISLITEYEGSDSILVANNRFVVLCEFIISVVVIVFSLFFVSNEQNFQYFKGWGVLLVLAFVLAVIFFYSTMGDAMVRIIKRFDSIYFHKYNSFKVRQLFKQADQNAITIAILSFCMALSMTLLTVSGSAYNAVSNELQKYIPYSMSIIQSVDGSNSMASVSIKSKLREDSFDFSNIKKDTEITIYASNLLYKDVLDTSQLWSLDKDLGNRTVPIISVSDYNKMLCLQGKKGISLNDGEYFVNANYKGTEKQIQKFVKSTKTLLIGNQKLKLASPQVLSNVYVMTSVGNNDRGTLVVPDNTVDGLSIYQRNYDAIYRKNANKDYIKDFLEQLKKEDVVGNEQTYIYQTKDRLINMYLGFVGVVVLVLIFVGLIFTIISLSILSIQSLASTLDSQRDYDILFLLGSKQNRGLLFQQILFYFLVPELIGLPAFIALSKGMLGYFANYANTEVDFNFSYLMIYWLLFGLYIAFTYTISLRLLRTEKR